MNFTHWVKGKDTDMQKMLVLVRGLPGSGKSTFANTLIGEGWTTSADDYFYVDGEYRFDPTKLPQAHQECQVRTRDLLVKSMKTSPCVAVANTFSCRWEMQPYFDLAKRLEATVFVIDVYDGGLTDEELAERNSHGVPLEGIQRMRERWEHNWRVGNLHPPWDR
jgi:NEDD4-binding protein 2